LGRSEIGGQRPRALYSRPRGAAVKVFCMPSCPESALTGRRGAIPLCSVVPAASAALAPVALQPWHGGPAILGRASRSGPTVVVVAIATSALTGTVTLTHGHGRRRFTRQIPVARAGLGRGTGQWAAADLHGMEGMTGGSTGQSGGHAPLQHWCRLAHARTVTMVRRDACRIAAYFSAGRSNAMTSPCLPLASSRCASAISIASPAPSAWPLTSTLPRATCT
jgi:hypothetical protein